VFKQLYNRSCCEKKQNKTKQNKTKKTPKQRTNQPKQKKAQHLQYGQTLRLFPSQISAFPRNSPQILKLKCFPPFLTLSKHKYLNKVKQKAVVPHLYWDSMRSAINSIPWWDAPAASRVCWLIQNCHRFSTSHYDCF